MFDRRSPEARDGSTCRESAVVTNTTDWSKEDVELYREAVDTARRFGEVPGAYASQAKGTEVFGVPPSHPHANDQFLVEHSRPGADHGPIHRIFGNLKAGRVLGL